MEEVLTCPHCWCQSWTILGANSYKCSKCSTLFVIPPHSSIHEMNEWLEHGPTGSPGNA